MLVKEYVTPKGTLRQEVWKVPDYPHREIPLYSDHNVPPGRSKRYLVSEEADLPGLACILKPPGGEALAGFMEWAKAAKAFCDEAGILLAGNLSGVGDPSRRGTRNAECGMRKDGGGAGTRVRTSGRQTCTGSSWPGRCASRSRPSTKPA